MTLQRRARPFSLLDAIILIAATALGLALVRSLNGLEAVHSMDFINHRTGSGGTAGRGAMSAALPPLAFEPGPHALRQATDWLQRGVFWSCPFLSSWTLALVPLSLSRPAGSRRRRFRRPGAVVGVAWLAGSTILTLGFPQALLGGVQSPQGPTLLWRDCWATLCLALPKASCIAVASSWLALALSGRWAGDPGWLDRLGRGIGWAWIILGIARIVTSWLAVFYTN